MAINKDEALRRAVNILINSDGKEKDNIVVSNMIFGNCRLQRNLYDIPLCFREKVGVSREGDDWVFNYVKRRGCFRLSQAPIHALPTRVNEKEFIKAFDYLRIVYGDNAGFNMQLVKEPKKVNYRVVSVEIVPKSAIWHF